VNDVRSALESVLAIDDQILEDPARFRRAMADLFPDNERLGDLLGQSLQLGIPELIRTGHAPEALAQLINHSEINEQVAESIVRWWLDSIHSPSDPFGFLNQGPRRHDEGDLEPQKSNPPTNEMKEAPSGAFQVKIGCIAQEEFLVAISTSDGYFATLLTLPKSGDVVWRRLASPNTPLSRDLFVHGTHEGFALALWSDKFGISAVTARKATGDNDDAAPKLSLTRPSTIVPTVSADQMRYPIAALSTGKGLLDIFWTSDRRTLNRSSWRDQAAVPISTVLPISCSDQERLTMLDAARLNQRQCVLTALTDQSQIWVSEWDLDLDLHGTWRSITLPMDGICAISLLRYQGSQFLFACTPAGRMFAVEASDALRSPLAWRQINLPKSLEGIRTRSIALTSFNDRVYLAMSGKTGLLVATAAMSVNKFVIDHIDWLLK
jgi:hypothetical protein